MESMGRQSRKRKAQTTTDIQSTHAPLRKQISTEAPEDDLDVSQGTWFSACKACQRSKTKCDMSRPKCNHCTRLDRFCSFQDGGGKRKGRTPATEESKLPSNIQRQIKEWLARNTRQKGILPCAQANDRSSLLYTSTYTGEPRRWVYKDWSELKAEYFEAPGGGYLLVVSGANIEPSIIKFLQTTGYGTKNAITPFHVWNGIEGFETEPMVFKIRISEENPYATITPSENIESSSASDSHGDKRKNHPVLDRSESLSSDSSSHSTDSVKVVISSSSPPGSVERPEHSKNKSKPFTSSHRQGRYFVISRANQRELEGLARDHDEQVQEGSQLTQDINDEPTLSSRQNKHASLTDQSRRASTDQHASPEDTIVVDSKKMTRARSIRTSTPDPVPAPTCPIVQFTGGPRPRMRPWTECNTVNKLYIQATAAMLLHNLNKSKSFLICTINGRTLPVVRDSELDFQDLQRLIDKEIEKGREKGTILKVIVTVAEI